MADSLEHAFDNLELDFLDAVQSGSPAVAAFCDRLGTLRNTLELASTTGTLPQAVCDKATASFAFIAAHASLLQSFETETDELLSVDASEDIPSATSAQGPPLAAALPLFRYVLDNIDYPYPDLEEKEHLVYTARRAGWTDFDKKKCEDWLNRKRHQSGYVAIARKYCAEDTDAMRLLCRAALYGTPEQKKQIQPSVLEEIEEMQEHIQSQYDDLAAQERTSWVDELSRGVRRILDDPLDDDATDYSEDGEENDDDDDRGAFSDESDSDSNYTDFEDSDDEVLPPPIIGFKRKVVNLSPVSTFPKRQVSRTPSVASSISSCDSIFSQASFRSFSGSSVSSVTSVEWEEDDGDRPVKRSRNEESCAEPICLVRAPSSTEGRIAPEAADLWTLRSPHEVRSCKRKAIDDDCLSSSRVTKRSRYSPLGISPPFSDVSDSDVKALADVCSLAWNITSAIEVDFDLDVDSYTVDCTAAYGDSDASECNDDLAGVVTSIDQSYEFEDTLWARLQLDTLSRTIAFSAQPPQESLSSAISSHKLEVLLHQEISLVKEFFPVPLQIAASEHHTDYQNVDESSSPPSLTEDNSSRSPSVESASISPTHHAPSRSFISNVSDPFQTALACLFGDEAQMTFDPTELRVNFDLPPEGLFGLPNLDIFPHYVC